MGLIETKQSILKLIREAEEQFKDCGKELTDIEDYVAEYLTANGVIVPPCKIGDDVWWLDKEDGTVKCEKNGIKAVCYDGKKWTAITNECYPEDIGTDWLMLTKEEAEERLDRWKNEIRECKSEKSKTSSRGMRKED